MGDGISVIVEFIEVTYSVLICDDDPQAAADYVERIKEIAPPEYRCQAAQCNEDIRNAVNELLRRHKLVRSGCSYESQECLFDKKDILIIDYDLIYVDDDSARHTGEGIGRLARLYSDCAVVVVFNQFLQFDFDLSLRADLGSHADLNLNANVLTEPGLWTGPPWDGFRPWAWQCLSRAVVSQRAREALLGSNLDEPIADTLGMRAVDARGLSDTAFGFLAPKAVRFDQLAQTSFRSFVQTAADGDTKSLLSIDDLAAVRFGAARIGKWLEREVLGPQDVLIDVPHLLQRFPFLLGSDVSDLDAWNETIHQTERLREEIDKAHWFGPADCLSRPVVWCRRLEEDKDFLDRRAAFDYSTVPDIVFLEDASVFDQFSHVKQFRAGFHNFFDERFVKPFPRIRYGPQRRFAFASEM